MGRSRFALTDWHDAILERSDDSRFPIAKQTLRSIHFRRPSGVVVAHFAASGVPVVGPGTFADFAGDTSDFQIEGVATSYATAHSTATTPVSVYQYVQVGQTRISDFRGCYRGYLAFDTSSITAENNVLSVTKTLTPVYLAVDDAFSVQIRQYNWAGHTTQQQFEELLSAPEDDAIWHTTIGLSLNTPATSDPLDPAWINCTGTTYYGLLSSRDAAAVEPDPWSNEFVRLASADNATEGYWPYLTITYEPALEAPTSLTAVAISQTQIWLGWSYGG